MILLCRPNRVSRTYLGGARIDKLRGIDAQDGLFPEDWTASTTAAVSNEGIARTEDGRLLTEIVGGLPILLKLLDASERLVVQAHPTAAFAKENLGSDYGKAECWYILDADEGAHVYLGFKPGITRERWMDIFARQDIGEMLGALHKIPLKKGDVWYVDGGVPHAIGGGCLMAELQEPTDLMVVPERVTPGGRIIAESRLHNGLGFERMFDVFDYTGFTEVALREKFYRRPPENAVGAVPIIDGTLTDKFSLTEYRVTGSLPLHAGSNTIAVVTAGCGVIRDADGAHEVRAGQSMLITGGSDVMLEGRFTLLGAAG